MHSLATILLIGGGLLSAKATPIATLQDFSEEIANITARDLRGSLPVSASTLEHRFQPVTDFDTDGCYYTSAIDPDGNLNLGLSAGKGSHPSCLAETCRDPNRLENNNVYSRSRCNNGWCAIMYEYYFEKDQVVCGSYSSGHIHDWENIVVFLRTSDQRVTRVAPSAHGNYKGATNSPRMLGERAKVVYHKDGGFTHAWRMAKSADDKIENYTGEWFLGRLVGWEYWPSNSLRDKAMSVDSWNVNKAHPKLSDAKFDENLKKAAGDQVPGFDPKVDG
ncbi:necrosis inducing protein-domain-containing protein [Podospora didyma]|uniref:Necrosis inducing protein-domain-containing protein n=1 Tax=Podospora didyma TaxID=330526 RepID=A0AAE0TVI6_9PEZI|nr:necrosis inducing protein-domain-containing protein [Podospora didyma]